MEQIFKHDNRIEINTFANFFFLTKFKKKISNSLPLSYINLIKYATINFRVLQIQRQNLSFCSFFLINLSVVYFFLLSNNFSLPLFVHSTSILRTSSQSRTKVSKKLPGLFFSRCTTLGLYYGSS